MGNCWPLWKKNVLDKEVNGNEKDHEWDTDKKDNGNSSIATYDADDRDTTNWRSRQKF